MITLPEALQKFMQQQDLTGLKPYALLYRNKWVEEESGSGDTGHYELETTPIDITDMIVKPNTLSMTLDVNEVAQYNCNNVTLTLADTKNRFIEGTPNSLFPDGYQIYGSKVVLYYGIDNPAKDYIIEDDKLVWANSNAFLENNDTNNTWINADFIPTDDMKFEVCAEIRDTNNTWDGAILGSRSASGSQEFMLWHNTQHVGWGAFIYGKNWTQNWNEMPIKGTRNIFKYDGTDFTINGITPTQGVEINKTNFTSNYKVYLFGFNQNNSIQSRRFRGKIYYAKFWSGDTLIRYFVPVPKGLKIGNFTCPSNGMWDIATQTFFGNNGSGDFLYGVNKENNSISYAIVGKPTLTDEGILSNCSLTDFVQVNTPFAPGNKTWTQEYAFKIDYTTANLKFALNNALSSDYVFPKLTVTTSSSTLIKVQMCISFNGTSWAYATTSDNIPFDYSKKAWLKNVFDGTSYVLYLKQEGGEFEEVRRYNSSTPIVQPSTNKGFSIGADISSGSSWVSYFRGKIYLEESFIEIDGEKWFDGSIFLTKQKRIDTPLFTGSIKELPTHKPEQYQVELKLVSPLEMLKDIEAKNFSDKVIGETLTYIETDSDGHRIYNTTGTGVGGFDAVYADGTKLFEGVDYEVDQLNEYGKVAIVTIINSDYYALTITADYYTWKTGLTVEQIIAGLVGLAGYDSTTEDIKNVVWQTSVRNPPINTPVFAALGYYEDSTYDYKFNWQSTYGNKWSQTTPGSRTNILPSNFDYNFELSFNIELSGNPYNNFGGSSSICFGDEYNSNTLYVPPVGDFSNDIEAGVNGVNNGISVRIVAAQRALRTQIFNRLFIHQIVNGTATVLYVYDYEISRSKSQSGKLKISRRGSTVTVYMDTTQVASCTINGSLDYMYQGGFNDARTEHFYCYNQAWDFYDNNLSLYASAQNPCWISAVCDKTNAGVSWGAISANLSGVSTNYSLSVRFSDDSITWSNPQSYNLNTVIGAAERYLYYIIGVDNNPSDSFDINEPTTWYLAGSLFVNLVDLSGKTVLEALQDFALISGYEFGVDRNGVFFFKPRIASTTPIYVLDHSELTKVDTVKRNFSDFFTKLTLTFAQRPLEFYANTGYRPTPVDKYGIINKDIDKPEIVNYDNPELAQAIGPQLLEVYSTLSNIIQATGKLNLALELGDIVSLRRNMNLVEPDDAQEFAKYINSSIYYRACKITGMNYNFAKRQITYTLRDVTSDNNLPPIDAYSFPYELPIPLGKLIED